MPRSMSTGQSARPQPIVLDGAGENAQIVPGEDIAPISAIDRCTRTSKRPVPCSSGGRRRPAIDGRGSRLYPAWKITATDRSARAMLALPQPIQEVTVVFAVGKHVVAESESTSRRPREGVVKEVLRGDPAPRYRIRWDDGHESIYSPASGALKVKPRPRASRAAAPGR
jgi:hypothetical protein